MAYLVRRAMQSGRFEVDLSKTDEEALTNQLASPAWRNKRIENRFVVNCMLWLEISGFDSIKTKRSIKRARE